jgi:hypothetical protein
MAGRTGSLVVSYSTLLFSSLLHGSYPDWYETVREKANQNNLIGVGFTSPQVPMVPNFPHVMEGIATVVPSRWASHTTLTGRYFLSASAPLAAHHLNPPISRPTSLSTCPEDRSKNIQRFALRHTACYRWNWLHSSNSHLARTPTVRCGYSGSLVPASRLLLST